MEDDDRASRERLWLASLLGIIASSVATHVWLRLAPEQYNHEPGPWWIVWPIASAVSLSASWFIARRTCLPEERTAPTTLGTATGLFVGWLSFGIWSALTYVS
ncbi:hypothetical protein ABIE44_001570 [Marmoricola sp. OAE513]|uniref:hypothetical protein n=1 Tax=Marmoricola sp. OAE513 TaxID=2817894 RepID=UPI001AE44DCD